MIVFVLGFLELQVLVNDCVRVGFSRASDVRGLVGFF